jgi:diguanylate cyclase (GGDEF)-like protein/PAS domain S-box-containing protein
VTAHADQDGTRGQSLWRDALVAADELDLIGPFVVAEAIRDDNGRIVDFRILAFNRRMAALLPRRERAELVGGTWSELYPDLLKHTTFDNVVQVVETGEPVWVAPASRVAQQTVSGVPLALEAHFGRFRDGYICIVVDVTDRYQATEALSEVKDRYRRLLATAEEGIWIIDDAGVTTTINDACARLLGLDPADVVGRPALDVVRSRLDQTTYAFVERRLQARSGSGAHYELDWPRPDGSVARLWISSTPLYRLDGSFEASIALVTDITAQREAELRYRLLAENSTDVIRICDRDDVVTYLSPAAQSVLGYAPEEIVGRRWQEFLDPEDAPAYIELLHDLGSQPESFFQQARFRRPDGVVIWLESALRQIRDPDTGELRELQASSRDVTDRVLALRELEDSEERYRHRSVHDALTSLPNRQLLFDRLTHALAMSRRTHSRVGVLFIDIDNFKYINDSLGHEIGDQVLVMVGERIATAARGGDTVARFGGDEFVIVCEGIATESAAVSVAERVAALTKESLQVNGQRLRVTVSIGIALDGTEQRAPSELLRNADLAMYRAKQRGRNRWEIFDASLSADAVRRLRVETEMRDALEAGQLRVHYQPIADLRTGELTGVEALVRWEHPSRGLLLPAEFLDIAEETGLIVTIGSQVLHQACRDGAAWVRDHPGHPLTVAVNVSVRQLAWGDFTAVIDQALAMSGIDPRLLHLELTESALFDASRTSPTDLSAIDRLGVAIGIDDFGTGYSSLAYLKRFPVRFLKIDKSFVDGLPLDPEDTAIVDAIVNLGRTLGLDVIAEGVETPEQLAGLRERGCTAAQGFLLARPAPFDELPDIVVGGGAPAILDPRDNGPSPLH